MLVLYIVLVLSTLALLGAAAAFYVYVRKHMRESEASKKVGPESKS
jgi:hypothetical protein